MAGSTKRSSRKRKADQITDDHDVSVQSSLESLQSEESSKLLDLIVTCGDQSSGKSSVLEALTSIPFGSAEGLCTRFATEIVCRRSQQDKVSVQIKSDRPRTVAERKALERFPLSRNDFSHLKEIVDEATNQMGLKDSSKSHPRAFSRDVLSFEIIGPTCPQYTLVDLPGLIHSENRYQSKADVAMIKTMVEHYVKDKRTIVLAVVSAKNDYANQIILDVAKKLDASERTLGVITKPDSLSAGTEGEKKWIKLAQGKDIKFGLGWHMLRNRSELETKLTLQERNQNEADFFSNGAYRQLKPDQVGAKKLSDRLSVLITEHLKSELPVLEDEVKAKYDEIKAALAQLGEARDSLKDQRHYLISLSQDFHSITKAAVDGNYDHDFFRKAVDLNPAQILHNVVRLRAAVQSSNLQFANQMHQIGAKFEFTGSAQEFSRLDEDANSGFNLAKEYKTTKPEQSKKTYAEAQAWVQSIIACTRGRELPGNFNNAVISELFLQLSERWNSLATAHVERIADLCSRFVQNVISYLACEDVCANMKSFIGDELDRRTGRASDELDKLLNDQKSHPITYNPNYSKSVQKMRARKQNNHMERFVLKNQSGGFDLHGQTSVTIDPKGLAASFAAYYSEMNMEKHSASDALICAMAYYEVKLNYFVDAVTTQVIERNLLQDLATDILSPLKVNGMTDSLIGMLAADPPAVKEERDCLKEDLKLWKEGKKVFRSAR
ncbi:hypothetical protein MBLNU457_g0464t1 [Dothideomycetes sp. NU457]